jgi:hypothetical protein
LKGIKLSVCQKSARVKFYSQFGYNQTLPPALNYTLITSKRSPTAGPRAKAQRCFVPVVAKATALAGSAQPVALAATPVVPALAQATERALVLVNFGLGTLLGTLLGTSPEPEATPVYV